MSAKFFLDTNIFVYSLDTADPGKSAKAESLVTSGVTTGLGVISYQVVQEFMNVGLRQFRAAMTVSDLEKYFFRILLPMMKISSSSALFLEALRMQSANRLGWYDSLIVAAALQGQCKILYSEDLQHGRRFGDLMVQNPFL